MASSTTYTTIALELEDYDYGSLHSTVTNNSRLTASVDGIYHIQGTVNWATSTSGDRSARILLGGATTVATSTDVTQSTAALLKTTYVSAHYYLTAGQYVELQAFQNSGGSLGLDTGNNTSFSMALVSPLSGGGGGGGGSMSTLSDVDVALAVDGSMLRYESSASQWQATTAANLLLNDAGRLQIPTNGASGGIQVGSDITMARTSANILTMGASNKIQQATLPTSADDLTNQVYVDRMDMFYA
jgi:hypothetical protein